MKKLLLILFVLFAVNSHAFAVITPEESTSETYLKNHGYSDETIRLIELQHAQINGIKSTYKRNEPDWYTSNKAVSFVRKIFINLDGGLDDQRFMEHNIRYTNSWNDL